jgi:hypothetical protein
VVLLIHEHCVERESFKDIGDAEPKVGTCALRFILPGGVLAWWLFGLRRFGTKVL